MVRKLQLEDTINFVDPQAAFSFLYGDDRFIRKYHKEVNQDPDVEVSSWSEDGYREVKYTAPLIAPKLILKVAGTNVLRVKEKQQYKRCGNCFTIISDPIIEIPRGEQFVTKGELVMSPGEKNRGCIITINITLEFKTNVWGLQGAVEAFMETLARKSFAGWMKMASSFCKEELKQTSEGLPELEIDEYFDAEDIESPDYFEGVHQSRGVSLQTRSFLGRLFGEDDGNAESDITIDTWFVRSVLRELNSLQVSGEASRAHLESLNAKLHRIEQDISLTRASLHEQTGLVSRATACGLFGLGVATGIILAHVYFKHKQHI